MQNRTVIANVKPQLRKGRFPIKRIVGDTLSVTADIFGDGHDAVRAQVAYRHTADQDWRTVPMQDHPNDVWSADFVLDKQGFYEYRVEAWVDQLLNWYEGFLKKQADGQNMEVELAIGQQLIKRLQDQHKSQHSLAKAVATVGTSLAGKPEAAVQTVLSDDFRQWVEEHPLRQFVTTYQPELQVWVGRKREEFSTWYELFPRSASPDPKRTGTLQDVINLLPRVEDMGFDVLYLPPIHPIGKKNRKGRNNATNAQPGEPGSPWAIGSEEGGHRSIAKELGTLEDYQALIAAAAERGLEVALDLAFQCAPDHPYITEHPDWFAWRPDGTIAYAENPPKKYQDIVPINFETDDWANLWEELKNVILYWCEVGVRIFRVDNPHTKPYRFWEWAIAAVRKEYPDAIFLSEAFTRPKVMAELALRGFTQSYTYFTWRTTPQELRAYVEELANTESREYMRPNFWPNTPDILAYEMMEANGNQFVKRLLLAGTLSSSYGVYGPSYEFGENTGHTNGKEEYHDSEKYVVRHYDWDFRTRTGDAMTALNRIRRENAALQTTWNIRFTETDNPQLLSYLKWDDERTNYIWTIINFDTQHTQHGNVQVPLDVFSNIGGIRLQITDLLTGEEYRWFDEWNYVRLDPSRWPAHILRVKAI